MFGIVNRRASRRTDHGTDPNSGRGKRAVAITLRFVVGVKHSGDMMPRETLAVPSGSGHDTDIPWYRIRGWARTLNRAPLGLCRDDLHSVTILGRIVTCREDSLAYLRIA